MLIDLWQATLCGSEKSYLLRLKAKMDKIPLCGPKHNFSWICMRWKFAVLLGKKKKKQNCQPFDLKMSSLQQTLSFSFLYTEKFLSSVQKKDIKKTLFCCLQRCEFHTEDSFPHVAVGFWNLKTNFFPQLVACSQINPIKTFWFAPDWHWGVSDRQRLAPAPED